VVVLIPHNIVIDAYSCSDKSYLGSGRTHSTFVRDIHKNETVSEDVTVVYCGVLLNSV